MALFKYDAADLRRPDNIFHAELFAQGRDFGGVKRLQAHRQRQTLELKALRRKLAVKAQRVEQQQTVLAAGNPYGHDVAVFNQMKILAGAADAAQHFFHGFRFLLQSVHAGLPFCPLKIILHLDVFATLFFASSSYS